MHISMVYGQDLTDRLAVLQKKTVGSVMVIFTVSLQLHYTAPKHANGSDNS